MILSPLIKLFPSHINSYVCLIKNTFDLRNGDHSQNTNTVLRIFVNLRNEGMKMFLKIYLSKDDIAERKKMKFKNIVNKGGKACI